MCPGIIILLFLAIIAILLISNSSSPFTVTRDLDQYYFDQDFPVESRQMFTLQ